MSDEKLSPVARIALISSQFEALQKETAPQRAEHAAKQATAARAGELGPEWRKLQQRIDMNETTLEDVFSGKDESPEARALLTKSQRTLTEVGEHLAEEQDEDSPLGDPVAELAQLSEAFTARVEAMRNGWVR